MWALNEVAAMVSKAARGAGYPIGQAEDLARVAVYMAGCGKDCAVITQALQETGAPIEVDWQAQEITVTSGTGIMIGPVICDAFAMGCEKAVLADPAQRPLVSAYLALAGCVVAGEGREIIRDAGDVDVPRPGPVVIADADWAVWADLAARTYVPESDASRLAGAGAGLTDND